MIDARDHSDVAVADADAIDRIVRRHVDYVYAIARRKVGDEHLAEDVTQAVFILMMRKARHITNEAAMASWLYQATRYCSSNALRVIKRRKAHEREAAIEISATIGDASEPAQAKELLPLLDEAIEHLPRIDRAIVLMHFFQQKSHREVAMATGSSEEAVRKRAGRAVQRMRLFFAARGVVTGAGAIVAVLSIPTQAPAGLIESSCSAAMLSQWGQGPAFPNELARNTTMLRLTSLKIVVMLLILAGSIGIVMAQVRTDSPAQPMASAAAPDAQPTIRVAKMTGMMPEVPVPSIKEGLEFYQDKLGFKVDFKLGENYVALIRDGVMIAIHTINEPFNNGKGDYLIFVPEVDALHEELAAAGITAEPPKDHAFGLRFFSVTDPGGNHLYFGHAIPVQPQ